MLSRFQLFRKSPLPVITASDGTKNGRSRRYLRGWVILAIFTVGYLSWLAYRLVAQPTWPDLFPLVREVVDLGEGAGAFTLTFLWLGLWWRHRSSDRQAPRMKPVSLDELYALSPGDFEKYVGTLFRRKGYKVALRGKSGDHGVDLEIVGQDGRRAVVQCKRYQNTVGEEIVRELFGTMIHERSMRGFLVTTAEISSSAKAWAQGKPITLIDGPTLVAIAGSLAKETN